MNSLMTVREAAEYLKVNYMTIYKLAQRGRIPASKVGGNWRFNKEVLDQWLNAQSRVFEGSVLIIDDDAKVRDTLRDIVSESGYKTVAVERGDNGIKEVEKRHFDLVFLDLVLPGLTGVEVMRAIKARDEKTVIVIITGYGDDPIALQALSEGPLLLLRKPFRIKDITDVLNIVIKARH